MRPEPEPEPEPVVEEAPVAEAPTEGTAEGTQEEEKQGEGENLASQQQYNSGDIAEALSDSQLMNDSRADTTIEGEITQDSIQVMETLSSEVTTQSSTVVETTTTTVAEVTHSASSVMETVTTVTSSTTEETTTQVNNVDDDTKATQPSVEEIDTSDKLKELKITEDIDETAIAKKVAQEADTIVDTAVAS
ncbi:uncharacterized protein [Argopecten irradians]|uniref:uncharacterized protein n=1 Tax=Argopecten irradians TaxID=31199 RepID=UPI0037231F66